MKAFALGIALILAALAPAAFSQSTRTWVSGTGDDSNNGSRTSPCMTFTGALSNTAPGGEIDALDAGGFGAVTITNSVTIDGGAGVAGILVSGTNAIVISSNSATPIEVTLRNLDINGIGGGLSAIVVLSPAIVHVENCRIFGFTKHAIDFEPTGASALYVADTRISSCAEEGVYSKPQAASTVALENTHVDNCLAGVHGDANSTTVARNCSASGNTGAGFETTTEATMTIVGGASSLNTTGISSAGKIILDGVTVTNNATGLTNAKGGVIESFHNNAVAGNTKEGSPTVDVSTR